MKHRYFKSSLLASFVCLILTISGCAIQKGRAYKNQGSVSHNQYSHLKEYRTQLVKKQADLEREWAEVKQRYQMVALAYSIQQATIAELSHSRYFAGTVLSSLYTALTGGREADLTEQLRLQHCTRILDNCVGTATNNAEGSACFENFSKCVGSKTP